MKILVMSDLHLEFAPLRLDETKWSEVDVVILAGDQGPHERSFDFAQQFCAKGKHVIIVNGNHDYYRSNIEEVEETCRRLDEETPGLSYLQNDYVVIQGTVFLGCTLWTDYADGIHPVVDSMDYAGKCLADHFLIEVDRERRNYFTPGHALTLHGQSVIWLQEELKNFKEKGISTVVVTHHAPSYKSGNPRYQNDPLTPAFCSNLDAMIEDLAPRLWIHGHTHFSTDYTIGDTRVVSNQRGYPREDCGFDPYKIIEI